ncbi:GPI mannosyltransferase 1-like isoform X2 [Amphiura filiformis]|uniref:GPI mannosyltransferase 1-like isoform X2 n=1 Tax=Amphiura filiformis TaxID=82378 RepID=UPI003B221E90
MVVKYSDVDYWVFTDAARYITQGESPYRRATYRYTPLLAWLLTPNIHLTPVFGKLIFIICDVLAGYFIYKILTLRKTSDKTAVVCSLLWLFNPLPMTVSSRGNAESIMAMLVLGTLYAVLKKRTVMCAILLAISVHVKIYPATYALPLYFLVGSSGKSLARRPIRGHQRSIVGRTFDLFWPNAERLCLVVVAASVFVVLTGAMYYCYGWDFLQETYLYHVTRRDVRHNFSPYFYMLYLTAESSYSFVLGLLAFIPQLVLLIAVSIQYYADITFCCFVNTFLFVTFNKVCTSQYFLWYLCLLPLIVPQLKMKIADAVELTIMWFLGQGAWLLCAYYLEFEGRNTFIAIWMAGLLFFAINIYILHRIIDAKREQMSDIEGVKGQDDSSDKIS